jgi:hypothetical protein
MQIEVGVTKIQLLRICNKPTKNMHKNYHKPTNLVKMEQDKGQNYHFLAKYQKDRISHVVIR